MFFESLETRSLLSVSLLADINPGGPDSAPGRGVYLNGEYIFPATDPTHGRQLWASNGTTVGTAMLADLTPSSLAQNGEMTVIGGEAYFPARSSTGLTQIWKTDGTNAGTTLVYTLGNGNTVYSFVGAGSKVFFTTGFSTEYVTDGTLAGTFSLNVPGNQYVSPVAFGNDILFRSDTANGHQLWISDGTLAGTQKVAGFTSNTDLATLGVLNGVGYFNASDAAHGNELWKTDGTPAGTSSFTDINPGTANSTPGYLTTVGNTLFFTANDGSTGFQLWKTDGTLANTVRVTNLQIPSDNGILIYWMLPFGNQLLFQNVGNLYSSDGTATGTTLLATKTQPNGTSSADSATTNFLAISGGYAYFTQNSVNGYELSITDGTIAGTGQIANINPLLVGSYPVGSSFPFGFIAGPGGQVMMAATDGVDGNEPWVATPSPIIRGTVSGTLSGGKTGQTVFLDANSNQQLDPTELSTQTSADGNYSFSNVPVGAYTITQSLPLNYQQVQPAISGGITVSVLSAAPILNQNFTDSPPQPAASLLTGSLIGTSGSYQNLGNTAAKALDGSLATYFDGPGANGNWVGLDLGSPKLVTSIAYASRSGWASRMNGGIFQESNTADFSGGVANLYTIGTNANPSSGVLTTQAVSSTNLYRYVRYLSPNGSFGDISEAQFSGSDVAPWLVPASGAVFTFSNSLLTVSSGTVSIMSDPSITSGSISVVAAGSSTLQFHSAASIGSLTLNNNSSAAIIASGAPLVLGSLSMAAGTKFDLGTSSMIVDDAVGSPSSMPGISGHLQTGLALPGTGLFTSAGSASRLQTLGVLDNAQLNALGRAFTSFNGVTVDASSVLIKYTYYGDANFDGKVDGSDYSRIDAGFITHATGWYNGDLNDDGIVDGSDYTLIDNVFNRQGAALSSELAQSRTTASGQAVSVPPAAWWTDQDEKHRHSETQLIGGTPILLILNIQPHIQRNG